MKHLSLHQFGGYFLVGGFVGVVTVIIRELLALLSTDTAIFYLISVVLAYAFGIGLSYTLHRKITFNTILAEKENNHFNFYRFFIVAIIGLILTGFFSLTYRYGLNLDQWIADHSGMVAFIMASLTVSVITYLLNAKFSVSTRQNNDVTSNETQKVIAFYSFIVALALFKLWLISPIAVFGETWAGHDDRHFVDQAISLLHGQWLGQYNQYTLIKGPAYSMWLVFLNWMNLPLILSQEFLYILACAIFSIATRRLTNSFLIASGCYLVLILNIEVMHRVIRAGIYAPLTFMCFSFIALIYTMLESKVRYFCTASLLLGMVISIYWLTREEGVWLVPSIALCLSYILYELIFKLRLSKKEKIIKGLLVLLPLIVPVSSVLLVKTINGRYYNSFNVVEMNAPSFTGAYGSLTRVIPKHKIHYVPVSNETQSVIKEVSSAFLSIQPYLYEQSTGVNPTCTVIPAACGEIAGGWFMWALRDAVANAGYYQNGIIAKEYYQQLKKEIDQACKLKLLDCLPERDTLIPPMEKEDYYNIAASYIKGLYFTFYPPLLSKEFLFQRWVAFGSHGDKASMDRFAYLVNNELAPIENTEQHKLYKKEKENTLQFQIISFIADIYKLLWPLFFASALLFYGITLIFNVYRRQLDFIFILNSSLMIAVLIRVLILAIIDATSFPGINEVYLSPAYPLILSFILLSNVGGFQLLWGQIEDRVWAK